MSRRELKDPRQCLLGPDKKSFSGDVEQNVDLKKVGYVDFYNPSPERLCIGDQPLKDYLQSNDMAWVLRLREFLFELDCAGFASAYTGKGRKPGHPMLFIGLIIYGMLSGRWSLRELERLAISDLGAWWICGGLQPDHSTIGKFINLHSDLLTERFFIDLTRMIFAKLKLKATDVAGDGSVIESAGSRFKLLRVEAAQQAADVARHQAEENRQDVEAAQKAQRAQEVAEVAEQRLEKALERGNRGKVKVCVTDPEAVINKPKNAGSYRPSYKPSVLADRHRIILGQTVHPSNENAAVDPMLGQYHQIAGALPDRMMFDAGYFSFEMLERSIELGIDLLCPSGGMVNKEFGKRSRNGRFLKGEFAYDQSTDEYVCPNSRRLKYLRGGSEKGLAYRLYRCRECAECSLRERCTSSKYGRSIKRYEKDELKEAMTEVMNQPAACAAYMKRQAMVEPVYSSLRYRQGLNRFRRFGAKKVRLEFSLHCIAYNVGRLVRLEQVLGLLFIDLRWSNENNQAEVCLSVKIVLVIR